jgi:predicted RecB family endonuclease
MLKSRIYLVEVNSLALLELDLLIEGCLRADSYFISINDANKAALMRDCADITVLLVELMKRKSAIEIEYLNFCIEVWYNCRSALSDLTEIQELRNIYSSIDLCITSFRKYSLIS